jgi:tripartite-type tricarboxylate transporter receptor subunit TctC
MFYGASATSIDICASKVSRWPHQIDRSICTWWRCTIALLNSVAKQMQAILNCNIIVENRPGANGSIGGKAVQLANPDGYTLLFSALTHVLAKQVMANAPYDPWSDFSYVARVGEAPLLMVISPNLPQKNIKEVIEAAKKEPEKWTAGLPALGARCAFRDALICKAR